MAIERTRKERIHAKEKHIETTHGMLSEKPDRTQSVSPRTHPETATPLAPSASGSAVRSKRAQGELQSQVDHERGVGNPVTHFSNPFTNPHPFTLSNLSESAICTSDDEDNYSLMSGNLRSQGQKIGMNNRNGNGSRYAGASSSTPKRKVSFSNMDVDIDDKSLGSLEDGEAEETDEASDIFQSRPLTDTPVFSAAELENLDGMDDLSISDYDNSASRNHEDDNGEGDLSRQRQLQLLPHEINIQSLNLGNPSGPVTKFKMNSEKFKEHFDKLIPNPMERIESQETAVITTTSNSNNNSATNMACSSVFDIPGQTISKSSPDGSPSYTGADRLVVVMIGLPARGKSYLSGKMVRYLNWLQINAKIFNVGATRRSKSKKVGQDFGPCNEPLPDDQPKDGNESANNDNSTIAQDASFFSPTNQKSIALREEWARETLDSLLDYLLLGDGCVGVFDATNTTVARRKMVFDRIMQRSNGKLKVLFLESVCNEQSLIEKNVLLKLKGPDYKNMDPVLAKQDFLNRLTNYEKVYETISEEEERTPNFQFIQMVDVGRKIISCNIDGYIASQIVYYFLNFNLNERLIFVSRHGESLDNMKGRIGGDSGLTERGKKYSIALEKFVREKQEEFNLKLLKECAQNYSAENDKVTVISSVLKRAVQTAEAFNDPVRYDVKQLRLLNELGSGNFEGMTYAEIAQSHPEEFEERIKHKLTYRYPGVGGESYLDVISRLKPVINEIERSKSHLMVISHRVVCRILMAYFLNLQKDSVAELDIPLHSVYMFQPKPFGVLWHLWQYDEATNSFQELDLNKCTDNLKTVKQVGISFRERKYSVVPTAPFGSNESLSRKSSFRNSFKSGDLSGIRGALNDSYASKGRFAPSNRAVKNEQTSVRSELNRVKRG